MGPTGTVIRRRIEHDRPGELVQMDVKKLGRIPAGGGWRAWGCATSASPFEHQRSDTRSCTPRSTVTRLAYSEVLTDEKAVTAIGFWGDTARIGSGLGIDVEVLQADNGACYKAAFSEAIKRPVLDTDVCHATSTAMERQG